MTRRPPAPRRKRRIAIPPWIAAAAVLAALLPAALARAVAGPAAATQPAPADEMTFLQLLVKGGIFMIPIAACSLVAVALIVERAVALRRKLIIPPGFLDGVAAVGVADRDK